jgi:hypothetical protein
VLRLLAASADLLLRHACTPGAHVSTQCSTPTPACSGITLHSNVFRATVMVGCAHDTNRATTGASEYSPVSLTMSVYGASAIRWFGALIPTANQTVAGPVIVIVTCCSTVQRYRRNKHVATHDRANQTVASPVIVNVPLCRPVACSRLRPTRCSVPSCPAILRS